MKSLRKSVKDKMSGLNEKNKGMQNRKRRRETGRQVCGRRQMTWVCVEKWSEIINLTRPCLPLTECQRKLLPSRQQEGRLTHFWQHWQWHTARTHFCLPLFLTHKHRTAKQQSKVSAVQQRWQGLSLGLIRAVEYLSSQSVLAQTAAPKVNKTTRTQVPLETHVQVAVYFYSFL